MNRASRKTAVTIALTTHNNQAKAEALAERLVTARLAACVNIVPRVKSVYSWKGSLCKESELLLIIKTTRKNRAALKRFISDRHAYDTPELIFIEIADGSTVYLDWIQKNCDRNSRC